MLIGRQVHADLAHFSEHQTKFVENVKEQIGDPGWGFDIFSPYPFAVTPELHQEALALGRAVARGVRQVVCNYVSDPRIKRLMPLPQRLQAVVEFANDLPLPPFTLRPDVLFNRQGVMQICEINARFPANGFMTSQTLSQIALDLEFLNKAPLSTKPACAPCRSQIASYFDPDSAVAVLRGVETGYPIYWLLHELSHSPAYLHEVAKRGSKLIAAGQTVRQVALEMDRTELLKLPEDVIAALVQDIRCLNDVRALILVHDKRILSVLADRTIMADYLNSTETEQLARHIPRTRSLVDDKFTRSVVNNKDNWVLKPNSGGRGVGMMLGKETTYSAWSHAIDMHRQDCHVQERVEQALIPLVDLGTHAPKLVNTHIIGTLPCFGETCFGLGLFRGARDSQIINVHGGRGSILAPAVLARA